MFGTKCLRLPLMPCPFTGPKKFWAAPNFFARQKDDLHSVKFLGRHKIFGPAQKNLGPVKGQGISQP